MAESSSNLHFTENFRKASKYLVWTTIVTSILTILEWIFIRTNDERLMTPLTASLFLLSCFAFLLKHKENNFSVRAKTRANDICYFILIVCIVKAILNFSGVDAVTEHFWVIYYGIPILRIPTLMSANTIITFILTSSSILLLNDHSKRKTFIAQGICVIVFFISLFAAYGYILKVRYLYTLFFDVAIAYTTIFCFFTLALAILLSRPQSGFMRILVGEHLVENLILRLIYTMAPLLLGFLKLNAEEFGLVSKKTGIAIFIFISYAISWSIIAFNIRYQKKIKKINQGAFNLLKWNELRLSTIAENISEGVVIVKKNQDTSYINSLAKNIFKNFNKNLPIKKWPETYGLYYSHNNKLIEPKDLVISNTLEGKNIDNREIKLINQPNKEPSTLLLTGRPVKNSQGEVIEGLLIIKDISERRRIEREYYKTSIKLRTILAKQEEAIIILDEDGNHIYTTPMVEKLMGKFPSSPMNYKNWTKYFGLFYPDKFTLFPINQLPFETSLKGQECDTVRMWVKNQDIGDGHYINLSCQSVIGEKGELFGSLITLEKS